MCLFPKIIKNPRYKPNKKNGGQVPPVSDERTMYIAVGCNMCIECMKQKSNSWKARMMEEIKANKDGKFITLTFNNQSYKEIYKICIKECINIIKIIRKDSIDNKRQRIKTIIEEYKGYNMDNKIATYATRHFLERWRKKYKKSVRHWLVTELGHQGTENIHMHGIIFTDNGEDIEKIWQYGWVYYDKKKNYVSEKSINYITKYITKVDLQHKYYKPKILTSAGIGKTYTTSVNAENNKYKEDRTKETYLCRNGKKIALPKYWKEKIYTEEEREKLWIEKLDKGIRYVLGQECKTTEEYYATLREAQEKNKKLGYGCGQGEWKQQEYENERRKLIQKKRIQ